MAICLRDRPDPLPTAENVLDERWVVEIVQGPCYMSKEVWEDLNDKT
jgi:hypothetical protein